MKQQTCWIFVIVLVVGVSIYFVVSDEAQQAETKTVLLRSQLDLEEPVSHIVCAFQRRTGIRVQVDYVVMKGEADLLVLNHHSYMELSPRASEVTEIAYVTPVVLIHEQMQDEVSVLMDLMNPGIILGLISENGSVKLSTQHLFDKNNISIDDVELVLGSALELARSVTRKNIDVAIVCRSVANQYPIHTQIIEIDKNVVTPILVVLTHEDKDAAIELFQFFQSRVSKEIFYDYGYDPYPKGSVFNVADMYQ